MADLPTTLRRVAAHKGHLTRQKTTLTRAVTFLNNNPSPNALREVEDTLNKFRDRWQKVLDLFEQAGELDNNDATYVVQATAVDTESQDAVGAAMAAIHTYHEDLNAQVQGAAAGGGGANNNAGQNNDLWKVQTSLQPNKLTRDNTPAELRSWVRKFTSFHSMSKLQNAALVDQQAFVLQCVDLDLETYLRQKIGDTTPIFGPGGCIEMLEEKFRTTYPLFSRRLDWFNFQQAKGLPFTEFYARLRQKGDEAELANLDIDAQYIFRIICGLSDEKLKEKFLKLQNPSLDDIVRAGEAYEVANKAIADLKGKNGQAQGQTEVKYVRLQDLKGRCFNCGEKKHAEGMREKECKAKGVKCTKCNRMGHVTEVCLGPGFKFKRNKDKKPSENKPSEVKTNEVSNASVEVSCKKTMFNIPTPKLKVVVTAAEDSSKSFEFEAVPDSGTSATIIAEDLIKKAEMNGLLWQSKGIKMRAANKTGLGYKGSIDLKMKAPHTGAEVDVEALVSNDLTQEILISWHHLKKMGILEEDFPYNSVSARTTILEEDTSDNIDKVKKDFDDVFNDKLGRSSGSMKGPPARVELKKGDIKPHKVFTARQTPIHLREKADDLVKELLEAGVIVPETEPTDWCAAGHFLLKPDGKRVRMVTDYRKLNQHISRPVHPFESAHELIKRIRPDSKWFAKIDAVHGYYQIALDEESSKLTTFLLPTGKFRYKVLPMGLCPSSDIYCQRMSQAFVGLDWLLCIVDDALIQAPTKKLLFERLRTVLERCRKHGIKISNKKLDWGQDITFAGFRCSKDGVMPDEDKLAAISKFPQPKSLTDLRSFLGLVNQIAMFHPDIAHMSVKMRTLLKKDIAFVWTKEIDIEFEALKKVLCSNAVVKPFNPNLKTILMTDASRLHGIGYALTQVDEEGKLWLIEAGSKSLNPTQQNYAVIEIEAMAIFWAVQRCQFYLKGMPSFKIKTDHKPLLGVFEKSLSCLTNSRLIRYREKLVDYAFELEWAAGKTHLVADCLSRNPVFPADEEEEEEVSTANVSCYGRNEKHLQSIISLAKDDADYQKMIKTFKEGRNPKSCSASILFAKVWDRISLNECNLLCLDEHRIVLPKNSHKRILKLLHIPHAGITKTRELCRQLYYWPNWAKEVADMTSSCHSCQENLPSQQKEPLLLEFSEGPMEKVVLDLFELRGQHYLIMADRYSGWPFVKKMHSLTTDKVTDKLESWFNEWGWPKEIKADGGSQFRTAFKEWCDIHDIYFDPSSPLHSQSNGLAEAIVKSTKTLLAKCVQNGENFEQALLEFRNCPRANGFSPAMAFLGRRQRTQLPLAHGNRMYDFDRNKYAEIREKERLSIQDYDKGKPLGKLLDGQKVLVQDPKTGKWDKCGVIIKMHNDLERSYEVEIDQKIFRRNRRFLRPQHENYSSSEEEKNAKTENSSVVNNPRRSERLAAKKESVKNS